MMSPRPFAIHVPDDRLADLHARLERVRWPDEAPDGGWQYGSDLTYMKALVVYWREQYDWRAHEARLNRFPQFVAPVASTSRCSPGRATPRPNRRPLRSGRTSRNCSSGCARNRGTG